MVSKCKRQVDAVLNALELANVNYRIGHGRQVYRDLDGGGSVALEAGSLQLLDRDA